jgi:bifunctional UDP-N-acetylglucosamine pyrophosphorylase / glucosamine-1-phosphate N-acetyltransferase
MDITAVILAAGQGTRMKSMLPKMLHPLVGKPLILHSIDLVKGIGTRTPVVVVGHGAEDVRAAVGGAARFAVQEKQLGTGDAVKATHALLEGESGLILVLYADMPLITRATIDKLVAVAGENPGPLTMTTALMDDPHGFGRILRDSDGKITAIVEEAQASKTLLKIRELNVSLYAYRASWLWSALERIQVSPKGEYYLTDTVEMAVADGFEIASITIDNPDEAVGINNRVHLAEAEGILRRRINTAWMMTGVTLVDPATTYIEPAVQIGQDTTLLPNTSLLGKTVIGENCTIGPNVTLRDARLGCNCRVRDAVVEGQNLGDNITVEPYIYLK